MKQRRRWRGSLRQFDPAEISSTDCAARMAALRAANPPRGPARPLEVIRMLTADFPSAAPLVSLRKGNGVGQLSEPPGGG